MVRYMETLPYEVQCLIASYAHPIHPCKDLLETRFSEVPGWHLWLNGVEWDAMSGGTKEWLYSDYHLKDGESWEYNYFN